MFLYGKNSVIERLRANPASVKRVYLRKGKDSEYRGIEGLARNNRLEIKWFSGARCFPGIKETGASLKVAAEVVPFKYADFDYILNRETDRYTILFLDRIYDPQNLGGIMRTAACLGGFALVIPKFQACRVNETVLRVASGGENYLPVSMVSNLSNALISTKKKGYWIMGGVVDERTEIINETSLPFPMGIVLGSEGKGVRYGINRHIDFRVNIPMEGANLSLNVNTACAIFCYEIIRQRKSFYEKKKQG